MARFDVYRWRLHDGLLTDCQSDLNSSLATRIVVPLVPLSDLKPFDRLINPTFVVDGRPYVFAVQGMQTIPVREFGARVTSLADHDSAITGAIDRLFFGI